jgi:hypothetical protein
MRTDAAPRRIRSCGVPARRGKRRVPNWAVLTIGGLLTPDTCVAQFLAGPHEAFFAGGIDNLVCVAG